MPGRSHRRNQLQQELLSLGDDAMLMEEFDGFVAGLLVCPEMISPNEWLPLIWSREGQSEQSPLENLDHANRLFGLIMDNYNDVVLTLMNRPDRYRPLLPVDARNGDIMWEVWIEGFAAALVLRPSAWDQLLHADQETVGAMRGMLILIDIVSGQHDIPEEDVDELTKAAPGLIPDWVVTLHEWRLANYRPPSVVEHAAHAPETRGKVGRNELCPCGSGKKYKRCCGLN